MTVGRGERFRNNYSTAQEENDDGGEIGASCRKDVRKRKIRKKRKSPADQVANPTKLGTWRADTSATHVQRRPMDAMAAGGIV